MFPFQSLGKENNQQRQQRSEWKRDLFPLEAGRNSIPPHLPLPPLDYYHHCLIQHYRQQGFFPYFADPFLHAAQLRGEPYLPQQVHPEKQKQKPLEKSFFQLSSVIKVEELEEPHSLMQSKAFEKPQRSSITKAIKQLQPFSQEPKATQALIFAFQCLITAYVQESNCFKKAEEDCLNLGSLNGSIILQELLVSLRNKFQRFKKTKEEIIKFIIRRIYHNLRINKILISKPEYERLETFHEKNLIAFRSMNVQFLRREFSNPLFIDLFRQFFNELPDLFESENKEKIKRLALVMNEALIKNSTACLQNEKKMPWTTSYKAKIKKVCIQLLKQFEGSGVRETQEIKSSHQV